MKKRILGILLAVLCLAGGVSAQTVQFDETSTLIVLLARAKKEKKPLFIDCITTWCGPCKQMDKEVYTDAAVARFFKENYIAAKFQMDKTEKDAPEVQNRYADVKYLMEKYKIRSFPTLLYISAEGEIMQKGGYETAATIITAASNALDPKKNIPGMLKLLQSGQIQAKGIPTLVKQLKRVGQDSSANRAARVYMDQYLEKLPEDSMVTTTTIRAYVDNQQMITSKDRFFEVLMQHGDKIDSVYSIPGYARSLSEYIIGDDYINIHILENGKPNNVKPDWDGYMEKITGIYGKEMAEAVVYRQKFMWQEKKKQFDEALETYIQLVKSRNRTLAGGEWGELNTVAYNWVFKREANPKNIQWALKMMGQALDKYPTQYFFMDTYASLLYKARKVKEAIQWQEKAVETARKFNDPKADTSYKILLEKMKNGENIL